MHDHNHKHIEIDMINEGMNDKDISRLLLELVEGELPVLVGIPLQGLGVDHLDIGHLWRVQVVPGHDLLGHGDLAVAVLVQRPEPDALLLLVLGRAHQGLETIERYGAHSHRANIIPLLNTTG